MSDIPIFPAGANVGIPVSGAAPFPVENLRPELYMEGLQAGRAQPSTTSAVISGLAEGANYAQDSRLKDNQAQLLEARTAAIPMEQQLQQTHLETEQLGLQIKQQQVLQGLQLQKETLERQGKISGIFQTVRSGDVAGGITALENNYYDLAKVGIAHTDDGKGARISLDPAITSQLADLPSRAAATGDPRLVARAQNIVRKFQDTANQATAVTANKPIDLLNGLGKDPAPPEMEGTLDLELGKMAPTIGNSSPGAAAEKSGSAQASAGASEMLFGRPSAPVTSDAEDAEANVPISQRLLSGTGSQHVPHYTEVINARANELQSADANLKRVDALRQAKAEQKEVAFPAEAEKTVLNIQNAAADYTTQLQRAKGAFRLIDQLQKENVDLNFGPTDTINQVVDKLEANLSGDPQKKLLLDQAKAEIEGLGKFAAFQSARELGLGTRAIDTEKEQQAFQLLQLSGQNSLERNMTALGVIGGKAQEFKDMSNIIELYRRDGYSFGSAMDAAQQYRRANPSTVSDVSDTGVPILKANPNKENVYQFLDDRLNLKDRLGRKQDGRLIRSAPASPLGIANSIQNSFTGKATATPTPDNKDISDISSKISGEVSGDQKRAMLTANASDIPDKQPQGVNEATVRRMVSQESSADPNAVSGKGAQGLMQLMPGTGKELWKELGLPGAYDPNDAKANVMMGTTYMNKMLKYFGGDTRLALAAYNAGPERISKAYQQAEKHLGDTSWDAVQLYLPDGVKKETIPYVTKIMGEDGTLEKEAKTVTPEEQTRAIDSLKTVAAQNNARARLSPQGMQALRDTAQAKTPDEVKDSPLGQMVNMLMAADPFAESKAQASELGSPSPDASSPGAEPTPSPTPAMLAPGAGGPPSSSPPASSTGRVPSSTPSPSPLAAPPPGSPETQPGDLGWIGRAGSALYNKPAESLHAAAMGAGRSALFGFDDEAGALLRMAAYGEDYGTAVETTRAIRDKIQQENPEMYLSGQVGGTVANVGTLATKGLAKLGLAGAKEVGGAGVAKTFLGSLAQGGKAGAVYGGLTGLGEGEGSFKNREERAMIDAGTGAIAGAAGSALVNIGGRLARTETAQALFNGIKQFALGEKPKFNDAELFLFKRLHALGPEEFDNAVTELKASSNPASALIDEIGEGNIKQLVDSMAKDPETGVQLQKIMGHRLDQRGERVKDFLNNYTDDVAPAEAAHDAANVLTQKSEALQAERKAAAAPLYEEAKNDLPKQKVSTGEKEGEPLLYDAKGNVLSRAPAQRTATGKAIEEGVLPSEVPVFKNEAVRTALLDPDVKDAVNAARNGTVGRGGALPENSFDVLQEAKRNLGRQAAGAEGNEKRILGAAYDRLRNAMRDGSDKYAAADDAFTGGSEKLGAFEGKAVRKLQDFTDSKEITNMDAFGKNLFSFDGPTLKRIVGSLDADGQRAIKNAARSHILNQLESQGERLPGSPQAFPNFSKNKDQINAIFGDTEGGEIIDRLSQERRIASSSNAAVSQGAQTFQRLAEQQGRMGYKVKNAANAVLNLATFGFAGTPGAARSVAEIFRNKEIGEDLASGIKKILLDKDTGAEFAAKVRNELLARDKKGAAAKLWDGMMDHVLGSQQKVARAASSVITAGENRNEPLSDKRRGRERAAKTKAYVPPLELRD